MYCRCFSSMQEKSSAASALPESWGGTWAYSIGPLICTSVICVRNWERFRRARKESARCEMRVTYMPTLERRNGRRKNERYLLKVDFRIRHFGGSLDHSHESFAGRPLGHRLESRFRVVAFEPAPCVSAGLGSRDAAHRAFSD